VIAYKFLRDGRVGAFSRVRWPEPSAGAPWVRGRETGGACEQRVHACRVDDLPEWLDAELWRVELDGGVEVDCGKLVASRGRLLERVEAWNPGSAADFAAACAARAEAAAAAGADAGYGADAGAHAASARANPAAAPGHAAAAAFIAAHAAAYAARDPTAATDAAARAGDRDALASERAWQARWLAEHLGLTG
jgi:hypothetical protein